MRSSGMPRSGMPSRGMPGSMPPGGGRPAAAAPPPREAEIPPERPIEQALADTQAWAAATKTAVTATVAEGWATATKSWAAATTATAAKGSAAVGDMPGAACGGAPAPRALFNSPRAQEVGLDGEVSAAASEGTRMAKDALSRSFQVREASQSGASSHVRQSEAEAY